MSNPKRTPAKIFSITKDAGINRMLWYLILVVLLIYSNVSYHRLGNLPLRVVYQRLFILMGFLMTQKAEYCVKSYIRNYDIIFNSQMN